MNERALWRVRLNRRWLVLLLIGVLPWLLLVNLEEWFSLEPMALFVIGLFSLLPTLRVFRPYKHALWALQEVKADEQAALSQLAKAQLQGMLWASLPAWLAALFSLLGLDGVGGLLLVFASVLAYLLYRIPVQLLRP